MNVLAILPGLIPSTIIGIVKPLERLADKNEIAFRIQTTGKATRKDVRAADAVVFCRNCDYKDLEFLYEAKRAGKYIVYDIDDNFFAIPTYSALGMIHRWSPRLFIVTEFFRLADVVRTYAKPVYDEAIKYNENVILVKSYFDLSLIDHINVPPRAADRAVRICYQTSRGPHDTMMSLFIKPLDRVIFDHPGKIEFHFWGKEYPPISNRQAVRLQPFQKNYNKFVATCYRSQFDIGLAPTGTDLFSQSKTNNKYREYGAMGVAGIYTRMPVYEACIEDGVNGLLVENTEEAWRDAIERLVNDTALRQRIIDNARADVRANYSIDATVDGWREILNGARHPRYGAVPPEPQEEAMNILVFQDEEVGLDAWVQPIREVAGFMGANLNVQPLEHFSQIHRAPTDVVVIVGARPEVLADAAWRVGHKPKEMFLVLVKGLARADQESREAIAEAGPVAKLKAKTKAGLAAPELTPMAAGPPVRKGRLSAHESKVKSALDEMCVMLGHVTIITNDALMAEGLKTRTRLVEDPSPVNDVKGEGLARLWIEALSQTPIRRRDRRLELRINHRVSGFNERLALWRINSRRPFRR